MSSQQASTTEPQGVEAYFTDVEELQVLFKSMVAAPALTKRLLIIHGVGGTGKTSLLQMFRLHSKQVKVPVALASGDDAKSAVDVFYRKTETGDERGWVPDLKADGIALPTFAKTLEHYRAIQAKVDAQAKKDAGTRAMDIAGKVASKTAEAAGVAVIGAALGSLVPGIGTAAGAALGGALVGTSAEAFVDWLKTVLKLGKPDIDLLLDPAKKLSEDFLADLAKIAPKKRIVLMLDTYERMTALDDWAREIAQRLHPNVLLVIAGRALPDWSKQWNKFMAKAQIEELKPMTKRVMHELVYRYYASMGGGQVDPAQVKEIIEFARGLPIAVNTAVYLLRKYQFKSFQAVRSEAIADLVAELRKGLPETMYPSLEAAATVRWFDQPILRAVTQQADVNTVYNELCRFPFARPRAEGFMLHDTVRETMDENLKVQDPERHRELHERAAAYFEARLAKATGEEVERLGLERLYHLIISGDESKAITESQALIDTALILYRRLFAESIMALLNQYLRQEQNRYWIAYLKYRVNLFNPNIETQVTQAKILDKVLNEPDVEPRLRALIAIALVEAPGETNIPPGRRIDLLDKAIRSGQLLPQEVANCYRRLASLYGGKGEWTIAVDTYTEVFHSYRAQLGLLGEIDALGGQSYTYLLMGEWDNSARSAEEAVILARQVGGNVLASALKTLGWVYSYRGELERGLHAIEEALRLAQESQDEANVIRISRRLAEIYDRQKCWSHSVPLYRDLIARDEKHGRVISRCSFLAHLGISYRKQGLLNEAEQSLLESLAHIEVAVESIALNGLGELYLTLKRHDQARQYFERAVSVSKERPYYLAKATLGLLAIELATSALGEVPTKARRVEDISIEHSYYDHLANLRLIQGHASWDNYIPEWGSGFDAALHFYQHALLYALRYNCFLLDEVLWGGNVATPLRPIIPHLLERGEEGRRMLVALRDWWRTGKNDIGVPRPDTISPIPEGIALMDAERIAREREPGDGAPQKTVVEKIEEALR